MCLINTYNDIPSIRNQVPDFCHSKLLDLGGESQVVAKIRNLNIIKLIFSKSNGDT